MSTVLPWLALATSATFGAIVGVTLSKVLTYIRRADERHREILDALDKVARMAVIGTYRPFDDPYWRTAQPPHHQRARRTR